MPAGRLLGLSRHEFWPLHEAAVRLVSEFAGTCFSPECSLGLSRHHFWSLHEATAHLISEWDVTRMPCLSAHDAASSVPRADGSFTRSLHLRSDHRGRVSHMLASTRSYGCINILSLPRPTKPPAQAFQNPTELGCARLRVAPQYGSGVALSFIPLSDGMMRFIFRNPDDVVCFHL